ncbi:MAG: thioredoxin [Cytophagales bacterium]|nr:MAG: thioredoxin [Cytophagales bacterium]
MVINATDSDFKTVISSHQNIVIKYFAEWCGTCKLMAPKYKRISDDEKYAHITFLEINAEENPEARKFASVSNLPFMAIIKNGVLIDGVASGKIEIIEEMLLKLE